MRRQVFSSGNYHFFADTITGWFNRVDKKGRRTFMLRSADGVLWDVNEDQWPAFEEWIRRQTTASTGPTMHFGADGGSL